MKVVLFCGGLGMRMREFSEAVPKPMVSIGYRPILWHLMKFYAHYGHRDFILCLGYQADVIKRYFLEYDECVSNDFVLQGGMEIPQLLSRDINDWRITFVDTGLNSNVGQRLRRVQPHLEGEPVFLANYADGLSDVHLPSVIQYLQDSRKVACFVGVKPTSTFHLIQCDSNGVVHQIEHIRKSKAQVNGGFFVFTQDIFKYIKEGEDLVEEPFRRLIEDGQLVAFAHDGFWACMDTFKEKQELEDLFSSGQAPWQVWNGRK